MRVGRAIASISCSHMKVMHGITRDLIAASVVTMGMFDGVHRGHQALLQACRREAGRQGLPAVALTYAPHPMQVLRPDLPVRLLTLLPEKLARLAHDAVDNVVIAEFTRAFSQLSAMEFLHDYLVDALHARTVVVGYRTTFGHSREGNEALMRKAGKTLGFDVVVVPPVEVAGRAVSSSQIRDCLDTGDVALAAELLGYRYEMTGIVVPGDGRGHELGIPTANLDIPREKLVPAEGVYVVNTCAPGVHARAVMSIGERPTFDRPRTLEVHLLDFHGDLYHKPLTVTFLARLRPQVKFDTPEALIEQIQQDIDAARAID